MRQHKSLWLFIAFNLLVSHSIFAATPIDMRHQSNAILHSFFNAESSLKLVSSDVDINKTAHTRLQQYYQGYPVWGGDMVLHVKKGELISNNTLQKSVSLNSAGTTLNGTLYQDLATDLQKTPNYIFTAKEADKAAQSVLQLQHKKSGSSILPTHLEKQLLVYIDKNNKAHWAFHVSFVEEGVGLFPKKPNYIVDAFTFEPYVIWDDLKTIDTVMGGGFGGNEKSGEFAFDDVPGNFPALNMLRDPHNFTCFLQNNDVTVKDSRHNKAVMSFVCHDPAKSHNNIYWDADHDKVNGAYSPGNDALYIGKVIKDMYQQWYGIPVLVEDNKPMMLGMVVHEKMENAYWDGKQMVFGDGGDYFYPLVSIGVGAHEISHGFTEQHSNLHYYDQSGALNESFSDMASQAAEYYATKKNTWLIGAEIVKAKDTALRYMDDPKKDCRVNDVPGETCSIDNAKEYKFYTDVHLSSGVYNKMFYLLSESSQWNVKKAFDVMVNANRYYWTPDVNFIEAGCDVMDAAKDLGYNIDSVVTALHAVGIDTKIC